MAALDTRSTPLLVLVAVLLFVVMVGAQLALTARATLLKPEFVARRLSALTADLSAPEVHEKLIQDLLLQMPAADAFGSLPAAARARITAAMVHTLSARWIQEELSTLANSVLGMLRGRGASVSYTLDLAARKEVLARELSGGVEGLSAAEVRSALRSIPDALTLADIVGTRPAAIIEGSGRLWVLVSMAFIFVGPAALLILCQVVGGVRNGLWVGGGVTTLAGLAVLAALALTPGIEALTRRLPTAVAWSAPHLAGLAAEVRGAGIAVSVAFAVVGAALTAGGISVALVARKAAP